MDLKEIDLSRDDGYPFNVDLTKEELDWVHAYLRLTVDGSGVGRETLSTVCKNVEGLNEAQSSCMRLVMWTASRLLREGVQKIRVTADDGWSTAHKVIYSSDEDCTKPGIREDMKTLGNDDAVKAYLKSRINSVYGADASKTVHPDEDCVLPGCDRYGGNDTYLRIRKVLGHKGAFDFCMGNVIKLVDRWEKKGDPAQNLEKLRDYSAQALMEWRLWNEKLS